MVRKDQEVWLRAPRPASPRHDDMTPSPAEVNPRAGMGVVFDRGRPEEPEVGGPMFGVQPWRDAAGAEGWHLRFGRPGPDLTQVHIGDRVWITSDPVVLRAGERAAEDGRYPLGRVPLELTVRGVAGEPLTIHARVQARGQVHTVELSTAGVLSAAQRQGISLELLQDKLGALGGTDFFLRALDASGLGAGLFVPVSELKELRRRMIVALAPALIASERMISAAPVLPGLLAESMAAMRGAPGEPGATGAPVARADADADRGPATTDLVVLCRTDEQLDALLDAGVSEVELDWMELVGLGRAVERARARGVRVTLATLRVQKPGEERIDAHLAKLLPDAVLVRSWGSLAYFAALPADRRPVLHGDFSLNITNSVTAAWVLAQGLSTITAAHDLDAAQLAALLDAVEPRRLAVTIHHHMPTFHTEHCVYAHLLSQGQDFRTCGRPCEHHLVSLRDRVGQVHPVLVDVGCRNTVFGAQAQSAASVAGDLVRRGVARLRVELVRETAAQAVAVLRAYQRLVRGELSPREVIAQGLGHEQFGVTRGTMRTLTVL